MAVRIVSLDDVPRRPVPIPICYLRMRGGRTFARIVKVRLLQTLRRLTILTR
jgi:hypothetical protein